MTYHLRGQRRFCQVEAGEGQEAAVQDRFGRWSVCTEDPMAFLEEVSACAANSQRDKRGRPGVTCWFLLLGVMGVRV